MTLRAVLAGFGLAFAVGGAVLAWSGRLGWFAVAVAAFALVDLLWVLHRKRRGEPG